jgi:hypothetical protein
VTLIVLFVCQALVLIVPTDLVTIVCQTKVKLKCVVSEGSKFDVETHVPLEMACLNFGANRHYQMHTQCALCTFYTQQHFYVHSAVVIVPAIDSQNRNTFSI